MPEGLVPHRLRILHRDLGYFAVGISLVYAVSGIILNHKKQGVDPAYKAIAESTISKKNLSVIEFQAFWEEEINDVKKSTSEVINQIDDVAKAAGGSKRKGKKPTKVTKSSLRTMKKVELIFQAKKDFGIKLDSNLSKTALINKVYELHHKK